MCVLDMVNKYIRLYVCEYIDRCVYRYTDRYVYIKVGFRCV